MIAACCIICHDHFEGDTTVMACPCGHTFHEDCLLTWLANSSTCPQCRKRSTGKSIIRLYFEAGSDSGTGAEEDPSKLKNEVNSLRAELRKRESAKSALEEENQRQSASVQALSKKVKALNKGLQAEQTTCEALKKQLSLLSYQIDEAKQAKKEAKRLREKLQLLERLQRVLTENAEATETLLNEYGDGPRAARELATYCVTLKREFETTKTKKTQLLDQLHGAKRTYACCSNDLKKARQELERTQGQLRGAEEDLQRALEEKSALKERLSNLQTAAGPPTDAGKSALTRLIMESPAPCQFKSPKLSGPENGLAFDLDDSVPEPGSPATPGLLARPSPSTLAKEECREFGLPFVKTTSLAHKNKKLKSQASEDTDTAVMSAIASSGLFSHRRPLQASSSNLRNGYNGLGGHGSFIKPSGITKATKKRKLPSTSLKRPPPKFPTLDSYL